MSEDNPKITHEQAPQPADKPVLFEKIKELDQALDYALGGFHVCVDKVGKGGSREQAWNNAGWSYFAAYSSLLGLRGVEGDHLPMAKDLLTKADAMADEANKRRS